MSSKPQADSGQGDGNSAQRQPLPFEPLKNRKPKASKEANQAAVKVEAVKAEKTNRDARRQAQPPAASSTAIPDSVSRRMVKRMAILCGIPSLLGMSTFVISYLLITNDLFQVPTYAVLLVSLGWFGLGVLGLSYGMLSASWDEEVPGTLVGWTEFTTNWGRMREARRSAKNKS
ncbi:MAG TPA: PAM68 family protein [Trichocoleus sp.]|jgi:hypothetical protein